MHAQTHSQPVTTVTGSYLRQWLAPDESEDGVRIPPKDLIFVVVVVTIHTKRDQNLDVIPWQVIMEKLGKKQEP